MSSTITLTQPPEVAAILRLRLTCTKPNVGAFLDKLRATVTLPAEWEAEYAKWPEDSDEAVDALCFLLAEVMEPMMGSLSRREQLAWLHLCKELEGIIKALRGEEYLETYRQDSLGQDEDAQVHQAYQQQAAEGIVLQVAEIEGVTQVSKQQVLAMNAAQVAALEEAEKADTAASGELVQIQKQLEAATLKAKTAVDKGVAEAAAARRAREACLGVLQGIQ